MGKIIDHDWVNNVVDMINSNDIGVINIALQLIVSKIDEYISRDDFYFRYDLKQVILSRFGEYPLNEKCYYLKDYSLDSPKEYRYNGYRSINLNDSFDFDSFNKIKELWKIKFTYNKINKYDR